MRPFAIAILIAAFAGLMPACSTLEGAAQKAFEAAKPVVVKQGVKAGEEQIDKMVKDGQLTQEQGDAAKEALRAYAEELSK